MTKKSKAVLLAEATVIRDNTAKDSNTATLVGQRIYDETDSSVSEVEPKIQADLDANTNKVINLADPTEDQDAATKRYVDQGGIYDLQSPTQIDVGGMLAGTDITGLSPNQIIEKMIIATYYPILSNPSSSISMANTAHEVGELVTLSVTQLFDQGSINPQYPPTTSDKRSGIPNSYIYTGSQIAGSYPSSALSDTRAITNYKTINGVNTWEGYVSYDQGVQPYDSAANIYDSPLPAGTTTNKSVSYQGYFLRFFGATTATPTSSSEVRALPANEFQTSNSNTFNLNTGSIYQKFNVVLPAGINILSVSDETALGVDITESYILLGTISVVDGGGTGDARTYNLYEMNLGAPYSNNHIHNIITQ